MKVINVFKLAKQLQRYKEFRKVQLMLQERRKKNEIGDILLTLQVTSRSHTFSDSAEVSTSLHRGQKGSLRSLHQTSTSRSTLPLPRCCNRRIQELIEAGLDVEYTDRGGEVTYHGPGQIVMYPIIDLRQNRLGARLFVEKLENVMISLSASYGLKALGQIKDKTGVWIGSRKIGAIGVRISAEIR